MCSESAEKVSFGVANVRSRRNSVAASKQLSIEVLRTDPFSCDKSHQIFWIAETQILLIFTSRRYIALFLEMNDNIKWQIMPPLQNSKEQVVSSTIANPIRIGSSLWIVAKKQIIEYLLNSDSIGSITEHPTERGMRCTSCQYKDSILVVKTSVDTEFDERFAVFDTKTRTLNDTIRFPQKMGKFLSCAAVGDHIHFFHGQKNRNGPYSIYSMIDRKMYTLNDHECPLTSDQSWVPDEVIKMDDSYKSSSKMLIHSFIRRQSPIEIPSVITELISKFYVFEFLKFGSDSFYIGTSKTEHGAKPIQWIVAPEFSLKQPVCLFGRVQYRSFIVVFGGALMNCGNFADGFSDHIYILDLRKNGGWVQSSTRCPAKHAYRAVLVDDQNVHLLGKSQIPLRLRYCLNLKNIIPQSMFE